MKHPDILRKDPLIFLNSPDIHPSIHHIHPKEDLIQTSPWDILRNKCKTCLKVEEYKLMLLIYLYRTACPQVFNQPNLVDILTLILPIHHNNLQWVGMYILLHSSMAILDLNNRQTHTMSLVTSSAQDLPILMV